jgi:hypothetical protein
MKIPAIKKLVESYSKEELKEAEEQITNEEPLSIEVMGDDDGEQLTHIIAAQWVHDRVTEGIDVKAAIREYTQKVRKSIN